MLIIIPLTNTVQILCRCRCLNITYSKSLSRKMLFAQNGIGGYCDDSGNVWASSIGASTGPQPRFYEFYCLLSAPVLGSISSFHDSQATLHMNGEHRNMTRKAVFRWVFTKAASRILVKEFGIHYPYIFHSSVCQLKLFHQKSSLNLDNSARNSDLVRQFFII